MRSQSRTSKTIPLGTLAILTRWRRSGRTDPATPITLSLDRVKRFLSLNSPNKDGETLLHVAVRCGHPDFVDLLLLHGADAEARISGPLGRPPWECHYRMGYPMQTFLAICSALIFHCWALEGQQYLKTAAYMRPKREGSQNLTTSLFPRNSTISLSNIRRSDFLDTSTEGPMWVFLSRKDVSKHTRLLSYP